jgi:8-oxo-dGTP diphosphatase
LKIGIGKWNGPGGKFDASAGDKTATDTAIRETFEEVGVVINKAEHVGCIEFVFDGKPEWDQHCFMFTSCDWSGSPVETDEMRPQWFALGADAPPLPYHDMWADDEYWLPQLLRGERISRRFVFSADGARLLSHETLDVEIPLV